MSKLIITKQTVDAIKEIKNSDLLIILLKKFFKGTLTDKNGKI